jgi:predicted CoA-binding protein
MENLLPGLLENVPPAVRQKRLWFQHGGTAAHYEEGVHQWQNMTDIPKKVDWVSVFYCGGT